MSRVISPDAKEQEERRVNTFTPLRLGARSPVISSRESHRTGAIAPIYPVQSIDVTSTSKPLRARSTPSSSVSQTSGPCKVQVAKPHEPSKGSPHYKANGLNTQTTPRQENSTSYFPTKTTNVSAQSNTEDSDEQSEESRYSEANSPGGRKSLSWDSNSNPRSASETTKRDRREILLSGLGLGLTNVNITHLREEKRSINKSSQGSITEMHEWETNSGPNFALDIHETQGQTYDNMSDGSNTGTCLPHALSPNREVTSSKTPIDFSSEHVKNLGRYTPKPGYLVYQERSKSPAIFEKTPNLGNTSQLNQKHGFTPRFDNIVSKRNDSESITPSTRRAPTPTSQSRLPPNEHKDSDAISWSDGDSIGEGLSQDAQMMFTRLGGPLDLNEEDLSQRERDKSNKEMQENTLVSEVKTSLKDNHITYTELAEGHLSTVDPALPKTWRSNLSSSAYQSLLDRHGITEMKRQDVIFELCETEAAFVKSMKFVVSTFLVPLKSQGKWHPDLSETAVGLLECLYDITSLHSEITSSLHSERSLQFPLMLQFAEILRPFTYRLRVHQAYLVQLESVTAELDGIMKDSSSKLGQFILRQSQHEQCGGLSFTSFLLKPMQRLTKYPLFFRQIWELTPKSHPDHLSMFSLFNSTNLVIKVMEEVKAREEELIYVKELTSQVSGFPTGFQLAHRERRLIAQGLLRQVAISEKDLFDLAGTSKSSHPESPSAVSTTLSSPLLDNTSSTPLPKLAKLGPVTSPFFPAYHNKTPIANYTPTPYLPRRSYMSAMSRSSLALSEASNTSERTSSYSPVSSLFISSDWDSNNRPQSSSSSVFSAVPLPQTFSGPPMPGTDSSWQQGTKLPPILRKKLLKGSPIYAFVFNDLLVLTSQSSGQRHFQGRSGKPPMEGMTLLDHLGISRILGIIDRSSDSDMEYLFQLDILPMLGSDDPQLKRTGTSTISVFFTLPTSNDPHLDQVSIKHLVEAKEKWLTAFNRSYGYTLRSLAFPPVGNPRDHNDHSVISLLSSSLPLPRAPLQSSSSIHQETVGTPVDAPTEFSRDWWSNRFVEVLQEVESRQEPPVMLIGNTAVTLGRGLKRVHTINRTKRHGPQKLLLPTTTISSSPSGGSNPNPSRRSFLGLKRR
ncbi:hypothetical protein CPB86DRAFT_67598 [Serendipita vermifera]|nr:hypothetical protein CPB86DRAFT_67598 [Serendipita vermifera]